MIRLEKALLLVAPEMVVRWHSAGFRLYWSISKIRGSGLAEGGSAAKCGI
jgi:hypothetical protein